MPIIHSNWKGFEAYLILREDGLRKEEQELTIGSANERIMKREKRNEQGRRFKIIFIAIVFATAIAFFLSLSFKRDISLFLPALYLVYVFVTVWLIAGTRHDLLSPLMVFIIASWLAFGLKTPILIHYPNFAFFSEGYSYKFDYRLDGYTQAFLIFLVGYLFFYLGYIAMRKDFRVGLRAKRSSMLGTPPLFLASLFLIMLTFYMRSRYLLAVPGLRSTVPFAGYIYYFLITSTYLFLCFHLYSALEKGSTVSIVLSLLLFALQGLFEFMLGWKGGMFYPLLTVILIGYYMGNRRKEKINVKLILSAMAIIFIFVTVFLFPLISTYRDVIVQTGRAEPSKLFGVLRSEEVDFSKGAVNAFLRLSGADNLCAVSSYFKRDLYGSITNGFFMFRRIGDAGTGGRFYTTEILGGSPEAVTANAPSLWGLCFMYGGLIFVAIVFFMVGVLSRTVHRIFADNIESDFRLVVLYALFISRIFLDIVLEGNLFTSLKAFIALAALYVIYSKLFDFLERFRRKQDEDIVAYA